MDTLSVVICLLVSVSVFLTHHVTAAKRDRQLYCGACQAMVDEVQYAIGEVNPQETIEIGFRIDPQGRQKVKKIPYAGSEVHLIEVLEDVCSKLKDYAESKDPATERKRYMRFNARKEGDPVELSNVSINGEISKALKIACQNIVEEFEEEIVQTFTGKEQNTKMRICTEIADVCTGPAETESIVNTEKSEL